MESKSDSTSREFNNEYDLMIEYEEEPWHFHQHENDKFIMEEMAKLPEIKALDLKYVQQCRQSSRHKLGNAYYG